MSTDDRTTRRDGWWRTAPALFVAVLALIIATAGASYAVAANSIGNAQLKSNAVTSNKIASGGVQSSDVKNGTLTRSDFRSGQLAPMPPGSSRIYFATVAANGALLTKSKGVSSSLRDGDGSYTINLGFDPTKCALVTTSVVSSHNVSADVLNDRAVYVYARNILGAGAPYADTPFSLTIVC